MSETVLTTVTFEPDWMAVYIDGELYDDGHDYQESEILKSAMVDHNIDVTAGKHVYPDKWRGTPETLEEVSEMYE